MQSMGREQGDSSLTDNFKANDFEPLLWGKSSRKLAFSGDLVVYREEMSYFVELMNPSLNMFSLSVHLVKDYFK